jgi:transposase
MAEPQDFGTVEKVLFFEGVDLLYRFMQTKRERLGYEMMLLPPLESFIPEDHRLRKLNGILDLSFVHEAVRDRYCPDNGRPSLDPEVVVRLFMLQAIEGIRSVRELMREVQVNLAYRWFIGYRVDESLPDHSTLSKALERFGDTVFNALFERSIVQCKGSGLIEGRVLHLDATTIRADLDRDKVGKADSPDPDARYGHFPDGQQRPGYKQHVVVDGQARVVVGMKVTSADRYEGKEAVALMDQVTERLGATAEVICADMAYGSGENRAAMDDRGIRLVSPPKPLSSAGGGYFTVDDFHYDETRDEFICPAGTTLKYTGGDPRRPDRRFYRASKKTCRNCSIKGRCTRSAARNINVSKNHAALIRLRTDSHTDSFKQLYRARAPVVEGVFAEEKCWHGLRRAWRRGLSKMRIQCLLIAAVINFKRLIAIILTFIPNYRIIMHVLAAFWDYIRPFRKNSHAINRIRSAAIPNL